MTSKILLFAAVAALGLSSAALADPPGGHPGRGPKHEAPQHAGPQHGGPQPGGPPGLAKKPYGMPPGQAKKMWSRGERLPSSYYTASRYYIAQPSRYRLAPAPAGYRWVLVEDDAYLVRRDNGLVANVVANVIVNLLR